MESISTVAAMTKTAFRHCWGCLAMFSCDRDSWVYPESKVQIKYYSWPCQEGQSFNIWRGSCCYKVGVGWEEVAVLMLLLSATTSGEKIAGFQILILSSLHSPQKDLISLDQARACVQYPSCSCIQLSPRQETRGWGHPSPAVDFLGETLWGAV